MKRKQELTETQMKNNLTTYFERQVSGFYSNTSEEDRLVASKSQAHYKQMDDHEKFEFAKAFQANKHSKQIQWMKDFTDTLVTKKKTTEAGTEKYMTRSFAIKGYMPDALWSVGASPIMEILCIW